MREDGRNGLTEQDRAGAVIYEEEQSGNQETEGSQPQTETSVTFTDKGKAFLTQMCKELNDFNFGQTMDENFGGISCFILILAYPRKVQ